MALVGFDFGLVLSHAWQLSSALNRLLAGLKDSLSIVRSSDPFDAAAVDEGTRLAEGFSDTI